MKSYTRILSLCFIIVLVAVALFPAMRSMAQVKKMSTKELTEESTAILMGKCSQVQSGWNASGKKVFTEVTVNTTESIKGNMGTQAVITVPGGQVGDILYEVSEMPTFQEGEEVLVFLWQHPSGKQLVTGAFQGKLTIKKNKETGESTVQGGVVEVQRVTQAKYDQLGVPPKRKDVSLREFIREIKSYIEE